MREYRRRQRPDAVVVPAAFDAAPAERIRALEEEVARLKRELAARQPLDRKAAQAQRDAILRGVNKGK